LFASNPKTFLFASTYLLLSTNVLGTKFEANDNVSISKSQSEDLYLPGLSLRIQAPIGEDVVASRKISISDPV